MKFSVINLGCKVNRVESDELIAAFRSRGGREASSDDADVVVVNTCTVTGEAEKKTRKAVRRALRDQPRARVIVTGCAVAVDAATYEAFDERVEVLSKGDLMASVSAGRPAGADGDAVFAVSPVGDGAPALLRVGTSFPTRVGVKVQDGCDHACTYCIVHVARGRAISRPADDVVRECTAYARAGVKEIVLSGINLGSYRGGDDLDARTDVSLADLLRRLLDVTEDLHEPDDPPVRFRLSSMEPRDVDEALVDLLAASGGRVCRHLHLPLQAGSDKVLREMARPYDGGRYVGLVDHLRRRVPGIALSTDVIVGFPGETDGEFQETCAVVRRCGFSRLHVFPYSRRAGTPAAARADQVRSDIRAARAATLRSLGDELRAADRSRRVGTCERALVEEGGVAMTESYFEVPVSSEGRPGTLVDIVFPADPAGSDVSPAENDGHRRDDDLSVV